MDGTDTARGVAGRVRVDVWSDIACPFCYLGTAALQEALGLFPHGESVDVLYHSYELTPDLAERFDGGANEFLAHEQGMPVAQAAAINAQLAARAATLGLDFQIDRMVIGSTRTAHRLAHFALEHGRQREMVERLFRAHYTEGAFIGDHQVLADLAEQVGLDRAAALKALEAGAYEDDVAADIRRARELGVRGVPFFVLDNKYAASGAQSAEALLQALTRVWDERAVSKP